MALSGDAEFSSAQRGLAALWREEQLTDVALASADGRCVQAHRVVLAAVSSYFRALFIGAGAQCAPPAVGAGGLPTYAFPDIGHGSLLAVVRVIYEGSAALELTAGNVCALLEAANYLDVDPVREACCQARAAALYARSVAPHETCALVGITLVAICSPSVCGKLSCALLYTRRQAERGVAHKDHRSG